MSTRCVINFCENGEVLSKIYRHSDGYPGKNGVDFDLEIFFDEVETQCENDTRFNDPTYLAAKFVVWQAGQNSSPGSLNFLSLGIMMEDPCDICYRWFVDCDGGRPKVRYEYVYR